MTLSTHRRRDFRSRTPRARVWLNDQEVTQECFYVDGRRGVVRLYVRPLRPAPCGTKLLTEERRGRVKVRITR
jgi:hypothetical protein